MMMTTRKLPLTSSLLVTLASTLAAATAVAQTPRPTVTPAATPAPAAEAPPPPRPRAAAARAAEKKPRAGGPGLSLSPETPQVGGRVTSPAEPPPVVAPEPSAEWKFEVTGYFRAPLRFSWGPATTPDDPNGDRCRPALRARSCARRRWFPTRTTSTGATRTASCAPWTELNFHYGNDRVKAQVQIASYNLTDPGYRRLESNLGINQAFLTLLWPELVNNENLHLTLTVGGFTNRYGAAGRYDAGKYETYLFGRTHVAGATLNVDVRRRRRLDLPGRGRRRRASWSRSRSTARRRDRGDEHANQNLPMWEPYPGPRPQESAFVRARAPGRRVQAELILGAHFIDVFANDNERSTAYHGRRASTPAAADAGDVAGARSRRPPKPRITIYGVDVKLLGGVLGDGYVGYSHLSAPERDLPGGRHRGAALVRRLAAARQLLRRARAARPVTGTIDSVLLQYVFSFGAALLAPAGVLGRQGPDLIATVFGMYNQVQTRRANPTFTAQQAEVRRRADLPAARLAGRRRPLRRRPAQPGRQRPQSSRCSRRG